MSGLCAVSQLECPPHMESRDQQELLIALKHRGHEARETRDAFRDTRRIAVKLELFGAVKI